MPTAREERIARNEASFRELNQSLEANVHRRQTEPEFAGFVCECGDGGCDTTVRVALDSYAAVRGDDKLFIVVPGHEIADTEDVVDEGDGYLVVRKHDEVAGIVGDNAGRG
jgi:hypothetical protein